MAIRIGDVAPSLNTSRTLLGRLGAARRPIRQANGPATSFRVWAMSAPLRPPASPTEHQTLDVLRRHGVASLDVLASDVAVHLYTTEVQRGGLVATVEHHGPHTYLPGVRRVILEAHDVLWHVEPVSIGQSSPRLPVTEQQAVLGRA